MPENKRLYRHRHNRVLGGVSSGLGEYFNVDPVLVRLGFVALTLINGLGLVIYFFMWLLIPTKESQEMNGDSVLQANLNEIGQQAQQIGRSLGGGRGLGLVGLALATLGVLFLLRTFFPDLQISLLWPLVFILIGLYLLFGR